MDPTDRRLFAFGDFTLDLASGLLRRGGREIPLRPKSFELLRYFVTNHGRIVPKDELMRAVWPDTFVTDDALLKRLKDLRIALEDEGQEIIRTVPRRGYMFRAEVTEGAGPGASGGGRFQDRPLHDERPTRRPRTAWLALPIAAAVIVVVALALAGRDRDGSAASGPPAPIRSIAVLPLRNLTNDPADEFFSDGMTESLITALTRAGDLKVISRGSVERFRGAEDPKDVGRRLGVAAVLEGSVRKGPDSVRVAVRLVNVEDGRVLWARDTQERALGNIFALQDEIARDVVAELRINLNADPSQPLTRRYTSNVDAYQAYLKGRYFWNKRTEAGLRRGIEYFEQAIAADPQYALAYVGLADSYLVLKSLSLTTQQDARGKVEAALAKALTIDETLGEAHKALAWVRFTFDRDWAAADREFRRALELQPREPTTHQWYAEFLSAVGRVEESVAAIRRAQELDPPSPIINVIAAQVYFYARRFDEAIEQCQRTLELDPDFYIALDYIAWAYSQKGMHAEALAAVRRAKAVENTPMQGLEVGRVEAASGDTAGARRALRELDAARRADRTGRHSHSYRVARIHAALGEADPAFAALERAFEEQDENVVWVAVDPHLDALRDDPRFPAFLRRVGFQPD